MKKAELRDLIDMWREVAMVRLSQVQGLEAEKRGLEERLAATQRFVAQQATEKSAPVAARPVLVDRRSNEWWPTVGGGYVHRTAPPWSRAEIEDLYGPVIEKAGES